MPYRNVHITIDKKTGKMEIETEGFKGDSCNVLDEAEKQLGKIELKKAAPERYQKVQPEYISVRN